MEHRIWMSIGAAALGASGLTACATASMNAADFAAAQRAVAGQWETSDRRAQATSEWGYARANEQAMTGFMTAVQTGQAVPPQIGLR